MPKEETQALSFVTKKALVTFYPHVALMINDSAIMCNAAICEYQQTKEQESRMSIPLEFTVIGLVDGKKLSKSIHLRVCGYATAVAMVELD